MESLLKQTLSIIITVVILTTAMIPSVSANVPPPLSILGAESGGLYTTATNVSMPYAGVNATIRLSGSWNYNINVSCTFYVLSMISQNLTTAFVYPSVWAQWNEVQNMAMRDFHIRVNGTLVDQTILSYDEFKFQYDTNQTDWEKVEDCDFAVFNFTIKSSEPIFIDVVADFSTTATGHDFFFEYVVDTARGWEGDTREIVNIDFERDLNTQIVEYRYYPNESLSHTGTNYTAYLTWDFHISNFPYSRVSFVIQQQDYDQYHGVPPPIPFPWIPILILVSTFVIISVGLRKTGRI
ncbi:MAG: hypothetical protein ACFFEE_11585 [Candidatus Thorarchaeota archaeon]